MHGYLMLPLSCCLPATSRNMGLQFKLSRFLRGAREDACIRPAVWMGAFTLEQLYRLMPGLRFRLTSEDAYAPMIAAYDRLAEQNADALDQTLDFFQRFLLSLSQVFSRVRILDPTDSRAGARIRDVAIPLHHRVLLYPCSGS
jgi:hypothetical protein